MVGTRQFLFTRLKRKLNCQSVLTRVASARRKGATLCYNNTHVLHLPPVLSWGWRMSVCVCVRLTLFITPLHSLPCGRCPTDARGPFSKSATCRGQWLFSPIYLISETACVYIQHHSLFRQIEGCACYTPAGLKMMPIRVARVV